MSTIGKKMARGILGSLASLGAFAAYRFLSTPPPQEHHNIQEGLDVNLESVYTMDGMILRLKRYIRMGAPPVILAHGFHGNGMEFDLPRRGRNLAVFLAKNGYDIWIANFRGCGRYPWLSQGGSWRHSLDHLAALDVPALVEGVTEITGRKPVWIGHSMGGTLLYMYLQGVMMLSENGDLRVVTDPELARVRNRSILGGVTIASPAAFHLEGEGWVGRLSLLPLFRFNLELLNKYMRWLDAFYPRLPLGLAISGFFAQHPRLGRMAAMSPLSEVIYRRGNVDADTAFSLIKWAGDNVSNRMFIQLTDALLNGELMDYHRVYSYTANMDRVNAPLFFVTGGEDFAGPNNIYEHAYCKVSSEMKRFECFPGYGHTDLVMGKWAERDVYPSILEWTEKIISLEDPPAGIPL